MFPANAFDTATLGVLTRALEDAWIAVQSALGVTPLDPDQLSPAVCRRVLSRNKGPCSLGNSLALVV
jgi:hypothetical protein